MLVRTCLGDVVADGVGLAGVGDTAGTALALGHHSKLAVHRRARQRPAIHLPLLRRWRWNLKRIAEQRERKKKNNHCKCTLHFLCLNKLFTHMHISPDVVYLYARGTVSTCKEARKIKMSGTVFRQRQQFFPDCGGKCSTFLIDLF